MNLASTPTTWQFSTHIICSRNRYTPHSFVGSLSIYHLFLQEWYCINNMYLVSTPITWRFFFLSPLLSLQHPYNVFNKSLHPSFLCGLTINLSSILAHIMFASFIVFVFNHSHCASRESMHEKQVRHLSLEHLLPSSMRCVSVSLINSQLHKDWSKICESLNIL